jgi:hypothetical protein
MGIFNDFTGKVKELSGIDKKYKCPYCLHEFTRSEAISGEIRGLKYKMCPNNENDSNGRPVCGKRLPLRFFDGDSIVISLIGGAGTGKTYYFMALKRILEDSELNALGISGNIFFPPGDSASEQYFNRLQTQIDEGNFLDATSTDAGIEQTAFGLEVNIDRNGKRKTVYFSFFDNPGEGFKNEDYIMRNMNIHKSDAVLFLLAPEQIRQMIPFIKGEGASNSTPLLTIMNNIVNILRRDTNQDDEAKSSIINTILDKMQNSKIGIPVAFCLSKYDLVEQALGIPIPRDLDRAEFHRFINIFDNSINYQEIDSISESIEDRIHNLEIHHLNNIVPSNFSSFHYFGVQSIEVKDGKCCLSPKGASLPIIWLLKQLNLL